MIVASAPASTVGASFIEFIVMLTVAGAESTFVSFALKVKLSLPW